MYNEIKFFYKSRCEVLQTVKKYRFTAEIKTFDDTFVEKNWRSVIVKEVRLHEGELNIMELLWSNKVLAAKDIAKIIKEYIGWEKNTTYTVIKRLIDKGAVIREEPGFQCKAAISKRTVQTTETKALLNKLYNGSLSNFFTEFLRNQNLTNAELMELQRIIGEKQR